MRGALACAAVVAALLLLAGPASAASVDAGTRAKIDRWVEAQMMALHIPGAAVVITDANGTIHARGFGDADAAGRAVTPETPFFVMSVTKAFTALVILQLEEEGKLAFDDPVRKHLPWFEVADLRGGEITIRHLLSHTSGLPTLTPGEYDRVLAPARPDDVEAEVRRLKDVALASAPGERWQYSNAGYTTLALVIETIEGRSYEDTLEARVFGPLAMPHAHARKADAVADGLAEGHRSWFGRAVAYDWDHSRIGTGSGFTYASAHDLGRFASMHLARGLIDGTRVATPEGIAGLQRPLAEVPSPQGTRSYGMGWFVEPHHGTRMVHHSGAGPNYHAHVVLLPDEGIAVAVVLNKNDLLRSGSYEAIGPGIASLLLGHEPTPPPGGGLFAQSANVLAAIDALLLAGLVVALRRLRTRPRARRLRLPLVSTAGGLAWAAITLLAAPTVWPLRGLWLSAPDLALVLTTSGFLGLAGAAAALAHAWRRKRAPT